jgi:hypothetical protein
LVGRLFSDSLFPDINQYLLGGLYSRWPPHPCDRNLDIPWSIYLSICVSSSRTCWLGLLKACGLRMITLLYLLHGGWLSLGGAVLSECSKRKEKEAAISYELDLEISLSLTPCSISQSSTRAFLHLREGHIEPISSREENELSLLSCHTLSNSLHNSKEGSV